MRLQWRFSVVRFGGRHSQKVGGLQEQQLGQLEDVAAPQGLQCQICWCLLPDGQQVWSFHTQKHTSLRAKEEAMTTGCRGPASCVLVIVLSRQPVHSARGMQVLYSSDQPFSAAIGQLILEAFTWAEGTYPASACSYVADTLFK